MPMQYTAIFHGCKIDNFQMKSCDIFLIFAQNIDCEAVLTSTHNLCLEQKYEKNVCPCKPQFYYIKVGCKGVFITRTRYPDELHSPSLSPTGSAILSTDLSPLTNGIWEIHAGCSCFLHLQLLANIGLIP